MFKLATDKGEIFPIATKLNHVAGHPKDRPESLVSGSPGGVPREVEKV